jgi:uncharacterized protein (TIGR00269 family)
MACKKPAEVKILYPFCRECFLKHYRRRIERLSRKFYLLNKKDKILMAVSGGKDSLSCADVLSRLREIFGFQMEVIHIDVGIPECTNFRTENVVRGFCRQRNIKFHFLRLQDVLGVSGNLKAVFRKVRRPLCSTCGMLKRYTLNKFAHENGFNKIATGHCADDITKFFFKNWFSQNFDWIAKFKPYTPGSHPKVVARIRPLFECLEVENLTYAKFNNIAIAGCSRCSYFLRKDKWDKLLKHIDEKRPDFKLNIVRGLEYINIKSNGERELNECKSCGQPTDKEICGVCRLKAKISLN